MKHLSPMAVIAFTFAAFLLPSYAGSVDLPAHGRSGGTGDRLNCGDGKVLIGLRGYKGLWLDRLQGKCRKISSDGRWLDSTTVTKLADGGIAGGPQPPPQPIDITCPANTAVKGMSGQYDSEHYITKISFRCEGLGASNTAFTAIDARAPYTSGDRSWDLDSCPDGKPARSIRVRTDNSGMRAVALTCHAGTTPDMEILAAPDQLVAVNLISPTGPTTTDITQLVQLSWVDRSTYELGFLIRIFTRGLLTQTIDRPAGSSMGSRQAVNLTDLPGGRFTFNVCSKYSMADGGNLCFGNMPFRIAQAPTCSPTINSVMRIGAGTARVSWTHTCTNPNNFTIQVQSGNIAFGTVATAFAGTDRAETFNFEVGISSAVRVCAVFPAQGATAFCSAGQSFQFNN